MAINRKGPGFMSTQTVTSSIWRIASQDGRIIEPNVTVLQGIRFATKPEKAKALSKAKVTLAAGPGAPIAKPKTVAEDAIRLRAYQKWEAAGRPMGEGHRFWFEAERELLQGR